MRFEFTLSGQGWADARIEDENGQAQMEVSHLTDALSDLLHAVWRSGEGDAETRCSWEDEPGEYRWILRRAGGDVRIAILQFQSGYPRKSDRLGLVIFETQQKWSTFAHAIALGASRVIADDGGEDYRDRWQFPFPTRLLELINAQLGAAKQ